MAKLFSLEDVIVNIHPDEFAHIASGAASHYFRNLQLPAHTQRIWIYEGQPRSALTHYADVGRTLVPGEVPLLNSGNHGTIAFNVGAGRKYAYAVLHLYRLAEPVAIADMKDLGWVNQQVSKCQHVRWPMLQYFPLDRQICVF